MAHALGLARRGLGRTAPNPSVGCVVLSAEGHVVGRGWTQPGGRPHAEAMALSAAGTRARGGTAFVTLEPCSHHGKTPPCADALIEAGISRVVCSLGDPDPRVSGRGFARLREAGIRVDEGLMATEAERVTAGFLSKVVRHRPLVTLKLATTLDGRIATATGHSQWITGPEARRVGHRIRAENDAILTGIGTVLADDPALTCRIPGLEDRSPHPIVVDRTLKIPATARLLRQAEFRGLTIAHRDDAAWEKVAAFDGPGVDLIALPRQEDRQLPALMAALAEAGVTRLLVEAGQGLSTSMLRAGLVDRIAWFRSSGVVGGDGLAAIAGLGVDSLDAMPRWRLWDARPVGADTLEFYGPEV